MDNMYVLTTHNNSGSGYQRRNKCRIYAPDIHQKMQDYKPLNPKTSPAVGYVVSEVYFPSNIENKNKL